MKEWVLFFSPHCPDCPPVLRELAAANVNVEYADITGTMHSLKRFLALRERLDAFAAIKEAGQIGIPALIKNEGAEVYFGLDGIDITTLPKK